MYPKVIFTIKKEMKEFHGALCVILVVCFLNYGVLGKPRNSNSTERCVTNDGRSGLCKVSAQCAQIKLTASLMGSPLNYSAFRSNCSSSGLNVPIIVCCPKDESAVVFPDEETSHWSQNTRDELITITAPNQTVEMRQAFISPGSVEFILPKNLPRRCGEMAVDASFRIVGGTPAPKGAWPWLARLGYYDGKNTTYQCAGVLITKQHVLTAAHCVHNRKDLIFVRLGENGLSPNGPHEYYIENITIHERFVSSTRGLRNDVAIIRLNDFVFFSDDIKPICLPFERSVKSIDMLKTQPIVAGWGRTAFYGPPSDGLMQVQLPIVPQAKCAQAYKSFDQVNIDQSVICAGFESGGKDACRGDSGGPLMIYHEKRYYAMGLVSFGNRCAQPGFPGVYARVTYYIGWIFRNIT